MASILACVLIPVAIEMVNEKRTGWNAFGLLGGVSEQVLVRDGKFRAQGPFGHAILAGTVGGLCIAQMIGIWNQRRVISKIGLAACITMVVASTSSGPLMTLALSILGLMMWNWQRYLGAMRIATVIVYLACNVIMTRPAYFLLVLISPAPVQAIIVPPLYRLRRIISANGGFAGTDYTRDWMPYGLAGSETQSDVTNHYLAQAVNGGMPLMLLFIAMIWVAFRYVGQFLRSNANTSAQIGFLFGLWESRSLLMQEQ